MKLFLFLFNRSLHVFSTLMSDVFFSSQAQVGCGVVWKEHSSRPEGHPEWFLQPRCQERPTGRISDVGWRTDRLHSSVKCAVQQATRLVSNGPKKRQGITWFSAAECANALNSRSHGMITRSRVLVIPGVGVGAQIGQPSRSPLGKVNWSLSSFRCGENKAETESRWAPASPSWLCEVLKPIHCTLTHKTEGTEISREW